MKKPYSLKMVCRIEFETGFDVEEAVWRIRSAHYALAQGAIIKRKYIPPDFWYSVFEENKVYPNLLEIWMEGLPGKNGFIDMELFIDKILRRMPKSGEWWFKRAH